MRIHYVLNNQGGKPEKKLADVEIYFEREDGILAGLKLTGCSVWKGKKGDKPAVMVTSRQYITSSGPRYYEQLCGADDDCDAAKRALWRLKDHIRNEYLKIAAAQGLAS